MPAGGPARGLRLALVDEVSLQVRLDGFHAVKHALRFGAPVHRILSSDRDLVMTLVAALAPDILDVLMSRLELVDPAVIRGLAPRAPASPILAFADRRPGDPVAMLRTGDDRPLIMLEDPRHAGNLGAAVRVAAAAGARGVLTTGALDPWSVAALRGSAGLHYAIEVAAIEVAAIDVAAIDVAVTDLATSRPVIALDPGGDRLSAADLDGGPVLVFGTERAGLSQPMLARADRVLALPMAPGVSSLNLATAVSATLFAWRLSRP